MVKLVVAMSLVVLAASCKRERADVAIRPDPARDASIPDVTEQDAAAPDTSPPLTRVDVGAAYNAILAHVPTPPPGMVPRIHMSHHAPSRCWPGDPVCVHAFEYGAVAPGATAAEVGALPPLVGRCEIDAHTGRIMCADFGKLLRHVGSVGAVVWTFDAGTD